MRRKYSGFTIVELIIVIIVIAILATLVITAYNGVQAKARDAERLSDAQAVQKFLEAYYVEHGNYINMSQFSNANASTALQNQLKGLDPQALRGPTASSSTVSSWGNSQANVATGGYDYSIKVWMKGAHQDTNLCNGAIDDSLCQQYVIYYRQEASGEMGTIVSSPSS